MKHSTEWLQVSRRKTIFEYEVLIPAVVWPITWNELMRGNNNNWNKWINWEKWDRKWTNLKQTKATKTLEENVCRSTLNGLHGVIENRRTYVCLFIYSVIGRVCPPLRESANVGGRPGIAGMLWSHNIYHSPESVPDWSLLMASLKKGRSRAIVVAI